MISQNIAVAYHMVDLLTNTNDKWNDPNAENKI